MVDSASKWEAAPLPDRSQTLMDRWLLGGEPETPVEAEQEEDDWEDHILMRIHRALEERSISMDMRGDGGYDARYVFSFLKSLDITPLVSVRIDSNPKGKDRAVLDQLGGVGGCTSRELGRMTKTERRANQKKWREHVRFGLRWLAEIVISAFKHVFGESVRELQPHTAYVEVATKIAAYNYNLDVGDEAIRAVQAACAAAWRRRTARPYRMELHALRQGMRSLRQTAYWMLRLRAPGPKHAQTVSWRAMRAESVRPRRRARGGRRRIMKLAHGCTTILEH